MLNINLRKKKSNKSIIGKNYLCKRFHNFIYNVQGWINFTTYLYLIPVLPYTFSHSRNIVFKFTAFIFNKLIGSLWWFTINWQLEKLLEVVGLHYAIKNIQSCDFFLFFFKSSAE